MHTLPTRRQLARILAGASIVVAGGATNRSLAQSGAIPPNGIGLPRAEWEDEFGEGTARQPLVEYENVRSDIPGSPIYVGYARNMVVHIEARWSEGSQLGGIPVSDAEAEVFNLMPADAILQDTFVMPPTPEGPIAFRAESWRSEVLSNIMHDSGTVLVMYQQRTAQQNPGSELLTVVPAVTITTPGSEMLTV